MEPLIKDPLRRGQFIMEPLIKDPLRRGQPLQKGQFIMEPLIKDLRTASLEKGLFVKIYFPYRQNTFLEKDNLSIVDKMADPNVFLHFRRTTSL